MVFFCLFGQFGTSFGHFGTFFGQFGTFEFFFRSVWYHVSDIFFLFMSENKLNLFRVSKQVKNGNHVTN